MMTHRLELRRDERRVLRERADNEQRTLDPFDRVLEGNQTLGELFTNLFGAKNIAVGLLESLNDELRLLSELSFEKDDVPSSSFSGALFSMSCRCKLVSELATRMAAAREAQTTDRIAQLEAELAALKAANASQVDGAAGTEPPAGGAPTTSRPAPVSQARLKSGRIKKGVAK